MNCYCAVAVAALARHDLPASFAGLLPLQVIAFYEKPPDCLLLAWLLALVLWLLLLLQLLAVVMAVLDLWLQLSVVLELHLAVVEGAALASLSVPACGQWRPWTRSSCPWPAPADGLLGPAAPADVLSVVQCSAPDLPAAPQGAAAAAASIRTGLSPAAQQLACAAQQPAFAAPPDGSAAHEPTAREHQQHWPCHRLSTSTPATLVCKSSTYTHTHTYIYIYASVCDCSASCLSVCLFCECMSLDV